MKSGQHRSQHSMHFAPWWTGTRICKGSSEPGRLSTLCGSGPIQCPNRCCASRCSMLDFQSQNCRCGSISATRSHRPRTLGTGSGGSPSSTTAAITLRRNRCLAIGAGIRLQSCRLDSPGFRQGRLGRRFRCSSSPDQESSKGRLGRSRRRVRFCTRDVSERPAQPRGT